MAESTYSPKADICKEYGSYKTDFLCRGEFKCIKCGEAVGYMGIPIYCECKNCRLSYSVLEEVEDGIKVGIMKEVGYATAPKV